MKQLTFLNTIMTLLHRCLPVTPLLSTTSSTNFTAPCTAVSAIITMICTPTGTRALPSPTARLPVLAKSLA